MAIPARVLRYQIFISTSITAAKYSLASALLETPPRLPTMSDSSSHATSNEYERLSSGDLTLLNHTPVKASLTEDGPWIHLEVKSQVAGYPNLQGSMSSYGFDENGITPLTVSGQLYLVNLSDLQGGCDVSGVVRNGFLWIHFSRNGKLIATFLSGDGKTRMPKIGLRAMIVGPANWI